MTPILNNNVTLKPNAQEDTIVTAQVGIVTTHDPQQPQVREKSRAWGGGRGGRSFERCREPAVGGVGVGGLFTNDHSKGSAEEFGHVVKVLHHARHHLPKLYRETSNDPA